MPAPLWQLASDFPIPAQPVQGFWTCVIEYVAPSSSLRFVIENRTARGVALPRWNYAPDYPCTADGDQLGIMRTDSCLLTTASAGALIAKIGGSCAGRIDDGKAFVVGSFCIHTLDADTAGPLYLTMNCDPLGSATRGGAINVQVSVSR